MKEEKMITNTNSVTEELDPLADNITARKITNLLEITAKWRYFSLIYGCTGRGKTLVCRHYLAKIGGVYLRCWAGYSRARLSCALAAALPGITSSAVSDANNRRII
ncbi:MAG: hypothetical protein PHQ27_08170, partial [Victivallales bacterium]|nr:hypothetical protein [Victivallales bacterium]